MRTVADQFMEILAEAGVKRIFGIVGDSLNGLTESVMRHGGIEWIHVRHEEVAAFAAGAEAHLTGDIAVCAGSCGPAISTSSTACSIAIARASRCWRSPRTSLRRRSAPAISRKPTRNICSKKCSHYCELVSDARQMPRTLEIAIREAVGQVARAISEAAADDAIFTCDVGLPTVWAARYLAVNGRRRLLGSFWRGSMANAMAQAIGAQAAFPGRQVVSLSGDGGFSMLMGDFLSLAQLKLPVKVVVFNNSALGFVELEQKSIGVLGTGTRLDNPEFAAIARAAGVHAIRLEDPADVEQGIAEALAHEGLVLVDAVVNRNELAMPPSVTADMARGFSLYMVKAIMNERTDEIIDLARTNLWR